LESIYFDGGTLVLKGAGQTDPIPPPFRWVKAKWRCEGYRYPLVQAWLRNHQVRDLVPRWRRLKLTLQDGRIPHDYQLEALSAWEQAGHRGSVVLPTGSGKTFVAILAIHRVQRAALVVAPTIDLLHQWYARLSNAFDTAVGVYYGGEKNVLPLTMTTYHSAGDLVADWGNQFKLLIYDECHHLPAPSWGETALMSPSPFRLGLTATYPEENEQSHGRWHLEELLGPIVYKLLIGDLAGDRLANYRTERIRVDLTPAERRQYDEDWSIYATFFRSRRLRETHGAHWLQELMRLSAFDGDARRALLARQRLQKLVAGAQQKLTMLDQLLREYGHEQVLIFTENNDVVYQIAERHLIPALTNETKAVERKHNLEAFQVGAYQAIVTSRVLNEGVDVPRAKVAIILGGTASAREYIQRLGRVLRKVDNKEAALVEVIVRNTVDEGKAQRRRPKQGQF
jgi:superfamily II DNA or RNA helicase